MSTQQKPEWVKQGLKAQEEADKKGFKVSPQTLERLTYPLGIVDKRT
jgi:hypothetical protein